MAASEPKPASFARPEAQPVAWDELTEDQRRAARLACEILADLADKRWAPPRGRQGVRMFLPPIDQERHNHVVLLDGDRGSGKTALLITLLNAWNAGVLMERPEPAFAEDLWRRTDRIVPVGLVDLQPLPPSTNLLIHLVGQLRRLVEAIEQQDGASRAPVRTKEPWHLEAHEESIVSGAWRRFLQAAAAGWDSGMAQRGEKVDLETYAYELDQVGRQRLDVITSFRELVDALAVAYPRALSRWPVGDGEDRTRPGQHWSKNDDERHPDWPLFVVAIDDADMNPERARELARELVPRLASFFEERCVPMVLCPLSRCEKRGLALQTCDPGEGVPGESAAMALWWDRGGHPPQTPLPEPGVPC